MRNERWKGILAGILLLICVAGCACARAEQMTVQRADGVGDRVSLWTKSDGQHYLFLPAYMRDQMLEIEHNGTGSVYWGDMMLLSGMVTDVIADGAYLRLGDGGEIRVMVSRNLPAVHVDTQSGSLDYIHAKKGNKEGGHVRIVTAAGETALDAPLDSIKGHGNATFVYEKKSYQIKLEEKAAFLGMNEGKTYVLLANQHENSLMRNRITFDLARALDLPYTPEYASVDLYVNGEYRGNYLLCDKVSIAAGSVDITDSEAALEEANEAYLQRGGKPVPYGEEKAKPGTYKGTEWPREPEDVTGGFLFELEYRERYPDETSGLVTPRGQSIVVKEPEEMSRVQGEYAYALLESFERAIFAVDGEDPQTDLHYTELADFDSLVRKYMIEEVCRNYDANKSSQYFFKDSDAVDTMLYAGPVWDYDSAWGNFAKEGYMELASPEGLSVARQGFDYSWWPALYRQKDFQEEVRRVYDAQMRPLLEVLTGQRASAADSTVKPIAQTAQMLEASADMNFERWRVLNHKTRAVKTGATYEANIAYLVDWIERRMIYLDKTW